MNAGQHLNELVRAAVSALADEPHLIRTPEGLNRLAARVCTAALGGRWRNPLRQLFFSDVSGWEPHRDEDAPLAVFVGDVSATGAEMSNCSYFYTFVLNLRLRSIAFHIIYMYLPVAVCNVTRRGHLRVITQGMLPTP